MLTEAASADAYGWIDGHAHEIAVPLVTTRPPAPSPLAGALPLVTNEHGQLPGSADAAWLYAKIYSHPERHGEIISDHLPCLLAALGEPEYWFVRYRSPHETDHLRLRLRLRTGDRDRHAECAAALTDWVDQLRHAGLANRLVFDTYFPEVGRYGDGLALHAAEAVFAADSRVVAATLRHNSSAEPTALVAVNMFDIVHGFLGDRTEAMNWLIDHPTSAATAAGRDILDQAVELVGHGPLADLPGWPPYLTDAWQVRSAALGVYRQQLPASADTDAVLESLLHLHHNRAAGIDPDHEGTCRRLARQAAIAWRARQNGGHR